ncbi:LPS export ABC transporter permease LptF [Niveispirillum sp. SYP-B3756]|nr:LPS export ABC transporter permease LptF [Niveispirillum sp. SYP-B3756]
MATQSAAILRHLTGGLPPLKGSLGDRPAGPPSFQGKMNQINRYLFRNLLIATLVVTSGLSAAIWLTQSLRLVALVVEGGASLTAFFRLAMLTFPTFLALVLPFGLLAAVLFTYHRLTIDSELVVMRAAGLGPLALSKPALLLGSGVMAACFALTLFLGPAAQRELVALRQSVRSDMSAALLREGTFNDLGDGLTVYVRDRLPDGTLIDLLIHDARQPGIINTVVAERGTLTDLEGQPRVLVHDGTQSKYTMATGKTEWLEFERYAVDLQSLRKELTDRWVEPRERTLAQLLHPNNSPEDIRFAGRLRAELHNRFASPFLALSFTIIALAALLPGEFSRRGRGGRITTAAVGALVLQASVMGIANLISKSPVLTPLLYAVAILPIPLGLWYVNRSRIGGRRPAAAPERG